MLSKNISFSLLITAFVFLESCSHVCITSTPDLSAFRNAVLSPSLQDSMSHNTLTLGMPYSAVRSVFGGCGCDTSIAVASSGSRQPLDESEGLYSHFHDPNIQIYLNKYKTASGDLFIWYGNMNFYRAEVSKSDSIILYSLGRIDTAIVASLTKPQVLRTAHAITPGLLVPYAEIHSREHVGSVSYWYDLNVIDTVTVKQQSQTTAEYPILHMELGTTPIKSFHWK
jgi:hypothetical protein